MDGNVLLHLFVQLVVVGLIFLACMVVPRLHTVAMMRVWWWWGIMVCLSGCSSLQQQVGMNADELRAVATDKSTAIVCVPGRLLILNRDLTPKDTGTISVDGPSCNMKLEGSVVQGVSR